MNNSKTCNMTGTSVPLGAIVTEENPAIGEFPSLKKFALFCKKSGLKIIQLLPVNDTGTQSSPYSGLSAFALHPIYIQISAIKEFKPLYESDKNFKNEYDAFIQDNPYKTRYDYQKILNAKNSLLMKLYESTETARKAEPEKALAEWIKENPWIQNYAVFKNLKWKYMQASWKSWKKSDQTPGLSEIEKRWNDSSLKKEHLFYAWVQMQAEIQFKDAADFVKSNGIILKGDMPIMMNEDSCDAWALPEFFNHDLRAGSPVDGENPTGQNWGFPTYNWKNLKAKNYSWWKERLVCASKFYGAYRLDHILGFFRIWAIPSHETTALLGHSEPCETISRKELEELGFDSGRINWLSQPHIPTSDIDYFTWNHDASTKILETLCTRVGNEELWNFSKKIKGDKDIYEMDLSSLCSSEAEGGIKVKLAGYWTDRALLEIEKDKFVPVWTYERSYPWETLSQEEKDKLKKLFEEKNIRQDKKWEKQASEILSALTECVSMTACGEDLGVNLPSVPKVMQAKSILGLRVLRWCRKWSEQGQPYMPLSDYDALSITTTSVHDSPTMRQWWNQEKDSARAFYESNKKFFDSLEIEESGSNEFNEKTASAILTAAASSKSAWCVHPIQDYLYLNTQYYFSDEAQERINIPGEVTEFNWTYRMPCPMEKLSDDKSIIEKIKAIADAHDRGN